MLDDLRRNDYADDFDDSDDDDLIIREDRDAAADRLFLGMTAVERMFLSMFFFMNVVVLGLAFLVATGRVVF